MENRKITVVEVGPRDGFQNIHASVPTDVKIETIRRLIASGIPEIEVTSFVHPKAIPQMYDSMEVAGAVVADNAKGAKLIALVPNAKGAENALSCGIDTVSYVISASEAHNKNNVNRTVEESCENLRALAKDFPGLHIRVDVATSFGCPFQGKISMEEIYRVTDTAAEIGAAEIVLCDTIGIANPVLVKDVTAKVMERYPDIPIALHLHDTRGMGLACTLAGLEAGVTKFESCVGGLGGCPFAPGAAGNTATEDMLNMLAEMGYETGVDFDKYIDAVAYVREHVYQDLTSRMINVAKTAKG